jgi:hypothetical protein
MKFASRGIALITLTLCSLIYAESQSTWNFDELESGTKPKNWELAETNGKGTAAIWEITERDENKVFAITKNRNSGNTASLAMIKVGAVKNVELSTRIKAGTPGDDAGGGMIWRVIDENHYYLARWDPIGKTCRLYLTIGGEASLLESVRVDADTGTWHQFDVAHNEETIEILFDGESVLEFEDNTLDLPGWIGLWAPGDAMPAFDDITFYTEDDVE